MFFADVDVAESGRNDDFSGSAATSIIPVSERGYVKMNVHQQLRKNRRGHLPAAFTTRGGVLEASRTHFEIFGPGLEGQVLGLGLETFSPPKLPCPRLENSTIF